MLSVARLGKDISGVISPFFSTMETLRETKEREQMGNVLRRAASGGHQYVTTVPLGVYDRLTPRQLMDGLRRPGQFTIKNRAALDKGATVELEFLGTSNPVTVKDIIYDDRVGISAVFMELEAQPGHRFKGKATHSIEKDLETNEFSYGIVGEGTKDEPLSQAALNNIFGNYGWPSLMNNTVRPLAKKLNEELPKPPK